MEEAAAFFLTRPTRHAGRANMNTMGTLCNKHIWVNCAIQSLWGSQGSLSVFALVFCSPPFENLNLVSRVSAFVNQDRKKIHKLSMHHKIV